MPTPLPPLTRTLMPTVPGYALDDDYTVSLLHMNGSDGSTVFWDESARLWTAAGNARIDTAQSKFGGASALFAGTGGYINTADSADWDTGPGDFTVDLWVRWNVVANSGLYSHGLTDGDRATL